MVGVGKRSFEQETELYVTSILERVKYGTKADKCVLGDGHKKINNCTNEARW